MIILLLLLLLLLLLCHSFIHNNALSDRTHKQRVLICDTQIIASSWLTPLDVSIKGVKKWGERCLRLSRKLSKNVVENLRSTFQFLPSYSWRLRTNTKHGLVTLKIFRIFAEETLLRWSYRLTHCDRILFVLYKCMYIRKMFDLLGCAIWKTSISTFISMLYSRVPFCYLYD